VNEDISAELRARARARGTKPSDSERHSRGNNNNNDDQRNKLLDGSESAKEERVSRVSQRVTRRAGLVFSSVLDSSHEYRRAGGAIARGILNIARHVFSGVREIFQARVLATETSVSVSSTITDTFSPLFVQERSLR